MTGTFKIFFSLFSDARDEADSAAWSSRVHYKRNVDIDEAGSYPSDGARLTHGHSTIGVPCTIRGPNP